jgi:hypothetical protein
MSNAPDESLLNALLDSWDRNNTILLNLLRAIPKAGLEARAMQGSPSIAEPFWAYSLCTACIPFRGHPRVR